jgi:hypothetical protein
MKEKIDFLGKLIYSFNHHKMITIVSTLFFFDTSKVKLKGKKGRVTCDGYQLCNRRCMMLPLT